MDPDAPMRAQLAGQWRLRQVDERWCHLREAVYRLEVKGEGLAVELEGIHRSGAALRHAYVATPGGAQHRLSEGPGWLRVSLLLGSYESMWAEWTLEGDCARVWLKGGSEGPAMVFERLA